MTEGNIITIITLIVIVTEIAIVLRVISSWLKLDAKGGEIGVFIPNSLIAIIGLLSFYISEPVLWICRKLPHKIDKFNLAPLIALIFLQALLYGVIKIFEYYSIGI